MNTLPIRTDPRFDQHFRNLTQVFFYLTDECNLRCTQCYYKPWLKRADAEVSTPTLLTLLAKFRENGASKLSLLGGEPTLYGRRTDNEPLPFIVRCARELGYSYIRLVSNGLFPHTLLDEPDLKLLDEITFSIDGDTAEMHDHLRGKGTFIRTCRSVRAAVARGYDVQIRRACIVGTSVGSQADISC